MFDIAKINMKAYKLPKLMIIALLILIYCFSDVKAYCPSDFNCDYNVCNHYSRPKGLKIFYIGGGSDDSSNSQIFGSYVTGDTDPMYLNSIKIKVTDYYKPDYYNEKVYFEDMVNMNNYFYVNSSVVNNVKLDRYIYAHFMNENDVEILRVRIKTDCTDIIKIGDIYGPLMVYDYFTEDDCDVGCNADECPNDDDKDIMGICGCGVPDIDSDSDGTPDCNDQCPDNHKKVTEGKCGCEFNYDAAYNVSKANIDVCSIDQSVNSIYMPIISNNLVFKHSPTVDSNPMLLEYLVNDTAVLQGYVFDENQPNINFFVNITFYGRKTSASSLNVPIISLDLSLLSLLSIDLSIDLSLNLPLKKLKNECYTDNGGDIDVDLWYYYEAMNGTMKAVPGSLYHGATLFLEWFGNPLQIGLGANGKNKNFGLSTTFRCSVLNQASCVHDNNCDLYLDDLFDQNILNLDLVDKCNDQCPEDPNKMDPGQCGCGIPDVDTDQDGILDCNDGCPEDFNKTTPGQCGCGASDVDTDQDGTPDCIDQCPDDPNKTQPGKCGCSVLDTDSDMDGKADCNDGCPNDPTKINPGLCGCGVSDVDTDNDGIPDCNDMCPYDSDKISPGQCGCGILDIDNDNDGVPDCNDGCPNDPNKTSPGVCECGVEDTDSDNDGTADCKDLCPDDPNKVNPGACGCGVLDTDSDNDGTPDCGDNCPNDPNKTSPGVCGCGAEDVDSDNDGILDCNDQCPQDQNKTQAGQCGCGISDADNDNDGVPNCNDMCPNDPNKTYPGICGCSAPDVDSDNDGTLDCNDNCPNDSNKVEPLQCGCGFNETDTDNDGVPDCNDGCPEDSNKVDEGVCGCGFLDIDSDNDGILDCNDACKNDPNKVHPGLCGCGISDIDTDYDGIPDCNDNCPNDPDKINPGQCGCGMSDKDSDNDGVPDCNDSCINDPNKTQPGQCGCDVADTDSDMDGIPDCNDGCIGDPNKTTPGVCGCGVPDIDSDNDGVKDCNDGCPNYFNKTMPGICGCGILDIDTDNDGKADCIDGCPYDLNKIQPGICGCGIPDIDTDMDGTSDCNDHCPTDPNKTSPDICGCGVSDIDSDNDGIPDCNDNCDNNIDSDNDGVDDCNDGCPYDPNKILPNICGCGVPDTDTDNDGVPDCNDNCPNDPNKVYPGICGCGVLDIDSDFDGVKDCNDGCSNDPNKSEPGQCGCGNSDLDTDGDGTSNCNDECPDDYNKTSPDICGCGVSDVDSDNDGKPDCKDHCPNDPNKIYSGVCGCGVSEVDTDNDGTPDCNDACPNDPNKIQPGQCGCGVSDIDADNDGTPNCNDGCPNDPNKTSPGPAEGMGCGCGLLDTDTDNDGIPDCNDGCPNDSNKTQPGQCGCGVPDIDSDNDGIPDCNDGCPNDPNKTSPGICGCGLLDIDSDSDGVRDCNDGCPTDPNKTNPGQCGCETPDTDNDNDGVPDCNDDCPIDPNKTNPGICGCGVSDVDSDYDGISDCNDGCPNDPNKTSPGICGCGVSDIDTDMDGIPDCNDQCDNTVDSDNDGVNDCIDQCPNDPDKTQPGKCGCGTSETDSDNDGVPDCKDNCPNDPNKVYPGLCGCSVSDTDTDNDGIPDCIDECLNDPNKQWFGLCGCGVLDTDTDIDGIPDCNDGCPNDPGKTEPGQCGCGQSDIDSDNDNVADCNDGCPYDNNKPDPGQCGCGVSDVDSDNDGTPDCEDQCLNDINKIMPGLCGCGVLDIDSDNDGTPDCNDMCPYDPNKVNPGQCGCGIDETDTDNDGTPDCIDQCPNDTNKIYPGTCGCGYEDIPDCCKCMGVRVMTFVYKNFYNHPLIDVVVTGSATPNTFHNITNGDFFTIFGNDPNGTLGVDPMKIEFFDVGETEYPFHTEYVDVDCENAPVKHGILLSYFLKVHKTIFRYQGSSCTPTCDFSLAIGVDVSNITTEEDLEKVKHALKYRVVQKLAGEDANIILYKFSDTATIVHNYIKLDILPNVNALLMAISSITLEGGLVDITNWVPILSNIHINRPSASEPETVLLFISQNNNDDINLAILAANQLKNGGLTKIIPIIPNQNQLNIGNIQAISGPLLNDDYFIFNTYNGLNPVLDVVCGQLCCENYKDLCGICFGDSYSCADCMGVPNGYYEFDICGICAGYGDECDPVECEQNSTLSIKELTKLEINPHTDYGKFEFKYTTSYELDTAVLVSFDPYENCTLRERGNCDNRIINFNDEYCDLFTVEYPDESVWTRHVNQNNMTVTYCANFTLYDLLECKDYNQHGPLVNVIETHKQYSGTLYGNVLKPNNCGNEADCELTLISSHYDFELWINNKGILSTTISRIPINFHATWRRNIWLRTGDVIVEFCTFIDSKSGETKLINPEILVSEETGVPFHISPTPLYHNCSGEYSHHDVTCKQTWEIRTYDAHGVLDFSGLKPIRFDVKVGEIIKYQVILYINLTIVRGHDPVIAHLNREAWLGLYRDPDRHYLVSPMDNFIDCTHVYAKVKLHNTTYLPIHIKRVLLCTGMSGDPLLYDPNNPGITGCNTPGIDIIVYTLYDEKLNYTNEYFHFVFDKEGEIYESFWKFEAKAVSTNKQLIEVHWYSDGYIGDPDSPLIQPRSIYGRASFMPQQYNKKLYSKKPYLKMISASNSLSDYVDKTIESTLNYSYDDDYNDNDNYDHGSYQCFKVKCPADKYYYNGICYSNYWYNDYYSVNYVWILILCTFGFVIILWFSCFSSCCSANDCSNNTHQIPRRYNHNSHNVNINNHHHHHSNTSNYIIGASNNRGYIDY